MLALVPFLISNWRLVVTGVALGAGLAWLAVEHHKVYDAGEAAAIQKVEKNDANNLSAADAAQKLVDDCYAGGGTWNRSNGVCFHP